MTFGDSSVIAGTTTWGDGHGDKRQHVIEDVSYRGDQNWITCRCGAMLMGDSPDELAVEWRAHGGKVMELGDVDRTVVIVEPSFEAKAEAAIAMFVELAARCTCATTDVRDCPNYMPGDEEPDEEGE